MTDDGTATWKALSEHQKRLLQHLARSMVEGTSCDITMTLYEGGIRDYRETKRLKPADMIESSVGGLPLDF